MLVLLCVQVVQTNNNESSWRGKINKKMFSSKRYENLQRKPKKNLKKKSNWQNTQANSEGAQTQCKLSH